jgi:hypothetical protein
VDTTQPKVALHRLIDQHFDKEELRTLCYGLDVDYDGLRGEGKTAKARELVALMERHGRVTELETAVRRARPGIGLDFEPRRAQELQTLLLQSLQPALLPTFQEFTGQVDAYLIQFTQLNHELEEWKKLHHLLQDLQSSFAHCRSYAYSLSRVEGSARARQRQQERLIYEAEVNWRPCKRILNKIKQLATSVQWISESYDPDTGNGPAWFLELSELSVEIDASFFNTDLVNLPDQLSAFGEEVVDQWLLLADQNLLAVVQQINQLLRPSSFMVQKR